MLQCFFYPISVASGRTKAFERLEFFVKLHAVRRVMPDVGVNIIERAVFQIFGELKRIGFYYSYLSGDLAREKRKNFGRKE